jgi:hypothetical protein
MGHEQRQVFDLIIGSALSTPARPWGDEKPP